MNRSTTILILILILGIAVTALVAIALDMNEQKKTTNSLPAKIDNTSTDIERIYIKLTPGLVLEGNGIGTLNHDGCEYLIYSYGNNGGITHKGNCQNPLHCSTTPNENPRTYGPKIKSSTERQ